MTYKKLFIAAVTTLTLAACSDELVESPPVVTPPQEDTQEIPIMFGSLSRGTTRAEFTGAEAAKYLDYKFVVSGYKGSESKTVGSIVFDNYVVKYYENSAYTTESNTHNWEYVGQDRIKHAIDNGITRQSTKYWDYTKPQYDFIAWSTGPKTAIYEGTPDEGEVLVSAITPNTAVGPKESAHAFTMQGLAKDLNDCYIADMVTVKKAQYGSDPVTIKFRSLGSKVRIGIYETIPGYSVKDVKFYHAANTDLPNVLSTDPFTPRLFTTTENQIYTKGKYTIYYPTVDTPASDDNNQAHVYFEGIGTQETNVVFGNLDYTIAEDGEKTPGKVFLGRSSNTASMAGEAEGNYYTQYLPNESGTNLNLRVDYTLESIDGSGETILVRGATAQVPSIYTQWKSGFAYTYLFKISDKTNGHTGVYDPTDPDGTTTSSDPAGLYPITFDAVVVNAEDNDKTQETITLVSTPSITTYQKGSTVVNNDEYLASTGDIYVTVNDGTPTSVLASGALQDLTDKVALYTIPNGKTEAEVVDALQMQDDDNASGTIKGRNGVVLTTQTLTLTNTVNYGVDGNAIEIPAEGTEKKAAKFTPTAPASPETVRTYAFVYTKQQANPANTTDMYQPVTKAAGASVNGLYRFALVAAPTGSDVQKGVTYFSNNNASAASISAFLGQSVSNLYLDNAGNTIASGYAVTGTTYYYTTDHGMSYQAATNISYESFASTTLYKDANKTTLKTETKPLDGQAYYDANGKYCVILPQQTTGLYVINEATKVQCNSTDVAVAGMTYFDKFTKNNGVYYTKVIKVQ